MLGLSRGQALCSVLWEQTGAGRSRLISYLAADRSLHARLENLSLEMGQARHQRVVWRQFDEPWEKEHGLRLGSLGSVIRDHDGRYRMYYISYQRK